MNANSRLFLWLLPVCLGLFPAAAAAQGSIGPLQHFNSNGIVTSFARAGSLAFFTTTTPTYPPHPYIPGFMRTDGTPEGTFSLDPPASAPIGFADSLGNLLFFTSARKSAPQDRGLWRSDGTVAGTFPVTEGLSLAMTSGATEFPVLLSVPVRSLVFFSASSGSGSPDFELWATDGTLEGTRFVKDINPAGSSNPRRMIAFDGRLLFFADTPQGLELWRSDGTPDGTERVHDFHTQNSKSLELHQAGGALFVLGNTASGVEVWRSDGTEAGTEQVLALNLPQRLYQRKAVGRHLFLVTWGSPYHEMWAIDGGTGEAGRVLQFEATVEIPLFAVGDQAFFSVEDDHGWEPWWSDGTPEGTRRIADLCPGPCSSSPAFIATYGSRAVFQADDGVSGSEPWLTDGTAAGTWRLGDLCPGECGSFVRAQEVNGWLVLVADVDNVVRVSDGTPDGTRSFGSISPVVAWVSLPDRILFASQIGTLASLPLAAPAPPPGAWLESPRVPGFRFKVQIDGRIAGRQEPACVARTLCVSGARPGRSEVFLRVSEPQSNGHRWPSLIKLATAAVDVWVEQTATNKLRHYRLQASGAGPTLPGILDRTGFLSASPGLEPAAEEARAANDPRPPGRWIESPEVPGFRVQARLRSNGKAQVLRKAPCIAETFCLSSPATPRITELLVRVQGPRPNKHFWPTLARFAPATLEVWIQQKKTGKVRYYRLNAPPAGSLQLDGYIDRQGFKQ